MATQDSQKFKTLGESIISPVKPTIQPGIKSKITLQPNIDYYSNVAPKYSTGKTQLQSFSRFSTNYNNSISEDAKPGGYQKPLDGSMIFKNYEYTVKPLVQSPPLCLVPPFV